MMRKEMTGLKIFIIAVMLTFANTAMAVNVTINHAGGTFTGTLSDLTVNPGNLNVVVTVSENLTPGGGSCTNTRPTINIVSPPTTATVGTPISASFTTNDGDAQTVTVTSNRGTITGGGWTWTPAAAGTYSVTLTANDGQSCNNTATSTWTVNVTSDGQPTEDLKGTILLTKNVTLNNVSIGGNAYLYYKIVAGAADVGKRINLTLASQDYQTKQDIMIKKGAPQLSSTEYESISSCYYSGGTTCTPGHVGSSSYTSSGPVYWFMLNKGPSYLSFVNYITVDSAGTYYIVIHNRSAVTGKFQLFYGLN